MPYNILWLAASLCMSDAASREADIPLGMLADCSNSHRGLVPSWNFDLHKLKVMSTALTLIGTLKAHAEEGVVEATLSSGGEEGNHKR